MNAQQKINMAVRYSLDASTFLPSEQTRTERQRKRLTAEDEAFLLTAEGWSLAHQGRHAEAEECYRKAFAVSPRTYLTHCGRQHVACGNYAEGWRILSEQSGTNWVSPGAPPRWNGQRLGGTLLVIPDDGLGDQIMYARFFKHVKARSGARIVVMTPAPLTRLFQRVEGVDEVFEIGRVPNGEVNVAYPGRPDAWVPMLALPYLLGIGSIESVPRESYLSPYPADIERWRPELPQQGLRVGLVWRTCASARQPERRSFPLATLAPLWDVPGVNFISLQRGDGEDEARASPLSIDTQVLDSRDLADTAALVSQLDLVIGTDVCVMNLAGAMGVPTCVLTDPTTDFRWAHGWYPGGRVFRQRVDRDWSGPVNDVATALRALQQALRTALQRRT